MKSLAHLSAFIGCVILLGSVGCGIKSASPPEALIAQPPGPTQLSTHVVAPSATTRPAIPTLRESPTSIEATVTNTPVVFRLCSPLEGLTLAELPEIISDPYHPPPMGKDDRHQGVDFSYYRRGEQLSIQGVTIQSMLAGRVAASIIDSFPFGNFVIVETPGSELPTELRSRFAILEGESVYILYAHLEGAPAVKPGDAVEACQALGQVGKSGNAGVAHLHLEIRHGPVGTQFPVMAYYLAQNTPAERANYLRWATSGEFLHFDPMAFIQSAANP